MPPLQHMEEVEEESVNSDIPDEHMDGMGYNEYIRRYDLNVKAQTWVRDSYGLYDYEMRNLVKCSFKFDYS